MKAILTSAAAVPAAKATARHSPANVRPRIIAPPPRVIGGPLEVAGRFVATRMLASRVARYKRAVANACAVQHEATARSAGRHQCGATDARRESTAQLSRFVCQ